MRYLLPAILFLLGCPSGPDTCLPNTTRCVEVSNIAQVCSADGEWLVLMDCNSLGTPGWACCRADEGCTCLPKADCVGGGR